MNPDVAVPVNWFIVVMLLGIAAAGLILRNEPGMLRKIAARCLARADALEKSRSTYEKSLRRWTEQLHIPAPLPAAPRSSALETRSNDV